MKSITTLYCQSATRMNTHVVPFSELYKTFGIFLRTKWCVYTCVGSNYWQIIRIHPHSVFIPILSLDIVLVSQIDYT